MSSFFASDVKKKVEQRKVSFTAQNGLNFSQNNKIVIEVDDTVGFFSGADSFLRFNVNITNTNNFIAQVDPYLGANVFFNTLRIFNRDNILLEEIVNYNSLVNIKYMYDTDTSLEKKRGMTEGVVLHDAKQMNWSGLRKSRETNSVSNPWIENTGEGELVQSLDTVVTIPICSGIFSSSKTVFPNRLMGGIRIELLCEENKYCFKGLRNAVTTGYTPTLSHVAGGNIGDGWPLATAAYEVFLAYENNMMVNNNRVPFKLGEKINIGDNEGTQDVAIQEIDLVTVTESGVDYKFIKITLSDDATPVGDAIDAGTGILSSSILATDNDEISYEISNVELIVEEVMVDDSEMVSKMKENGKIIYQCHSYQNYRKSVLASDTSATVMFNLMNSKAKSILVVPVVGLNESQSTNLLNFGGQRNNISGFYDTLQDYQWFYGRDGSARLQPDRPVNASKMSSGQNIYNIDYIIELEKALVFAGIMPRSFNDVLTNCVIGRVLALSNQVMDTRNMDFQLNINYNNPTKNKMLNAYVYHVREFVISNSGVEVVY